MLDFQAWIERNFGKWTWRELGIALGIVVASIVTFDIARTIKGTVWPMAGGLAQPSADGAAVSKRWRNRDDARGFQPLPATLTTSGDSSFDIAWISGSPISIRKAPPQWRVGKSTGYEMTDVMSRYLVALNGRPVRVQEYLLQGVRAGDMRRAVLFASAQPEIDVYVVEVNAVWAFNDFLQFTLSRQRASLLRLPGATWHDVSVAARILRPHEIGFEALGVASPLVRDRYDFFGDIALPKASAFPFRKAAAKVNDGAMMQNWMNWFYADVINGPKPPRGPELLRYRNLMLMSDLTPSGFGMQGLIANVKTLAATGKPVVMFMPPINPKLKYDPVSTEFVARMTATLKAVVAAYGGSNVTIDTDGIWSEPDVRKFLDIMHLNQGQSVVDRVAGLIEQRTGKTFTRRPLTEIYDAAPAMPEPIAPVAKTPPAKPAAALPSPKSAVPAAKPAARLPSPAGVSAPTTAPVAPPAAPSVAPVQEGKQP